LIIYDDVNMKRVKIMSTCHSSSGTGS